MNIQIPKTGSEWQYITSQPYTYLAIVKQIRLYWDKVNKYTIVHFRLTGLPEVYLILEKFLATYRPVLKDSFDTIIIKKGKDG